MNQWSLYTDPHRSHSIISYNISQILSNKIVDGHPVIFFNQIVIAIISFYRKKDILLVAIPNFLLQCRYHYFCGITRL